MIQVKYYLNGVEINSPANHKELAISILFDKDSPSAIVDINNFRFVNEDAEVVNNHINLGKTIGPGILEGMPFNIVASDGASTIKFERYIDFNDASNSYSRNDLTVSTKQRKEIDWFNDTADSFTFEYLAQQLNFINSSNYISIPYVINTVPNYREVIVCILGSVFISVQLGEAVEIIKGKIAGAANPFSSIGNALELALYIIYVITLLITLVKLIKDLIDLIIQPVKYHKGMYVKDILKKGCEYMALGFSSSILNSAPFDKMVLLPEKLENPKDAIDERILGFLEPKATQTGYLNGTFGDILRILKEMFNAKVVIQNNILYFERVDYNIGSSTWVVPDIRQDFYTYNVEDFKANYLIKFAIDINDKNTTQEYLGTILQATLEPKSVVNSDLKLLKELKRIDIPFALGKRKETLTIPEKIIDVFLTGISVVLNALIVVANAVIKLVNALGKIINVLNKVLDFFGFKGKLKAPDIQPIPKTDFGEVINDRIGMLMLENDVISVPKLILVNKGSMDRNNKIIADHKTYLSAKYLWDNFWSIDSFVPTTANAKGNQYIIKRIENVPFCFEDFEKVKNNSTIFDSMGRTCKIDKIDWNIWSQTASIEYRHNELYTSNLKISTYEGKGY